MNDTKIIDPVVESADTARNKKKISRIKRGVAAACFAVIVFAAAILFLHDEPELSSNLPMLSISENTSDGMGYEGYMAYDISELVNANPWNEESEISALPVYQNLLHYDENHNTSGADFDKMQEFILDVAGRLGLDPNNLTITDSVIMEAEGIKIEVDQTMTATLYFDPAVSLPEEYNFTHYASYADTAAAADYLKSEYSELIGMDNPQVNIHDGDYNIYSQQRFSIAFFDAADSDIEQIINYNFNRVAFYCDDSGALFLARVYQPDLSKKIGDYPIIGSDQAKEMLLNGNYISTVPYEFPGEEFLSKVELIYRTGGYEAYYMPYYRFYVELPEAERENGLKTYGAYYVPAVEGSYISNMPIWDGSFN